MTTMLELNENWAGYKPVSQIGKDAAYAQRLQEAVALIENTDGMPSHLREYKLKEAMGTSDFPLLFADTLERDLLARHKTIVPQMRQVCKLGTVRDFRTKKIFRIDGLTTRLQKVAEKGLYLAAEMDEKKYEYSLDKWGRKVDFSWEMLINDDLGAFRDIPQRLADACKQTEEYFITSLFWDADGPLDSYFSVANGGAAVAKTALNIGNLQDAVEAMSAYKNADGEPILNRPAYLVISPALEFEARTILTSSNKMWLADADDVTPPAAYGTRNAIASYGLKLIVNPWIPIIDTTKGATTWALFSDPRNIAAAEFGRLRGRQNPELWMKTSNQVRVGGGASSPFDGDFETDNIFYKVRYPMGGTTLDGRAGWASDGA